jgi:beta-fructofuranosidase
MSIKLPVSYMFIFLSVLVFGSWDGPLNAQSQFDEFNSRIIQDYIYAIHLYRDKLVSDRYRPIYHFANPEIGAHPYDPNGAIYWNGRYHLFYIIQPYRPRKGHRGDVWAHISSHDLVHWRYHPTALKPNKDDPEVAIYSGNTFLDKNGIPTIMYQGLGAGNCIAQALDDDLNNWKKSAANPVIPYPEYVLDNDGAVFRSILDAYPEYGKYDVWDPHAWLEGDTYYSISGDNDSWPAKQSTLWKSKDLENWELVGDFFHHGEPEGVLDCPDFFKLGNKYVLLFLSQGLRYVIGEFKDEQFYPDKDGTMTWGSGVGYAPESLLDNKGRRIMWAALYDRRTIWGDVDDLVLRHGWDGVLTLPRVLNLDKNNNLIMEPVEELKSLRTEPVVHKNLTINNSEKTIDNVQGDALELDISIKPNDAKELGLRILCSPDGREQTSIIYDTEKKVVRVDLSKTSLDSTLMRGYWHPLIQEASLKLSKNEALNFHIFIDKSVLEIFVNGQLCLTHKVYPSLEESKEIRLYSVGGEIEVPEIKAWKMHPSNPW